MAIFFSGWIGYGTAMQGGSLVEPTDTGYARCPFVLGDLDSGIVSDVGSGTVGPAVAAWGSISFEALFDAQVGGNLLLWMPMRVPVPVGVGRTITSGTGRHRFFFPDLQSGVRSTFVWPAGAQVARTSEDRVLTAGVPLQFAGGHLAAQTATFGVAVTMASLPAAQPTSGTGLLWNNGGIISIA